MALERRRKTCCMKAEMKKVKAEAYEFLARDMEKVKYECHLLKNMNQRRREVERRLNRSEDVSRS